MTRLLGQEGRGAYALIQNQAVLISMLLWLNITFGLTYYTAKREFGPKAMVKVATTGLLFTLITTPCTLLLVFGHNGLHALLLPGLGPDPIYWLYILLTILTAALSASISGILLGQKHFKILNQIGILNASLSAVGFLTLYLLAEHIPAGSMLRWVLIISLITTGVITMTWCAVYVKKVGIMPTPEWSLSILKPFFSFVLIGYLGNLINLVNYRFDIWVVGQYAGTAQLGLYAVAVGMGQLFFYIPEPFSRVVQPFLYEDLDRDLLEKFKFISRINCTSILFLSLVLGLSATWIIPLLFGNAFAGSVSALLWLLPGIVFVGADKLIGLLVVQAGLIRFNLYAKVIAAAITVVLDLTLIPRMGIVGASIASSCAYLAILIVPCLVIHYKMGITVWDMFLVRFSDLRTIRSLIASRLPLFAPK